MLSTDIRPTLLSFCSKTMGFPYRFWMETDPLIGDEGPLWVSHAPRPSLQRIKHDGVNCAGLINLVRRELHLPLPLLEEGLWYAGGTGAYFEYFEPVLKPYDPDRDYPTGTLLVKDYVCAENQGHLAMVWDHTHIVHSWTETPYSEHVRGQLIPNGVQLTPISWIKQHMHPCHVCFPNDWLSN